MERVATMERIAINILILRRVNGAILCGLCDLPDKFPVSPRPRCLCGEIPSVTASTSNRVGF